MTRAKFEELNYDLFKNTLGLINTALEYSVLKKNQIDEIVLVGGSTIILKVRYLVKEFFNGKEPKTLINPDEVVTFRAAVQGVIICGDISEEYESLVIIDATPLTPDIKIVDGVMTKIITK